MNIFRDKVKKNLFLSQGNSLEKVLQKFNMIGCRAIDTTLGQHFKLTSEQSPRSQQERDEMRTVPYANAIGSILYSMVCSRPDLAFVVSMMGRFTADPGNTHWEALKWVLRYVKGTLNHGLLCRCFKEGEVVPLPGFVDSDFAGSLDTRKLVTNYIFTLFGTDICWKSNLQSVVALSSTEAEYIA